METILLIVGGVVLSKLADKWVEHSKTTTKVKWDDYVSEALSAGLKIFTSYLPKKKK